MSLLKTAFLKIILLHQKGNNSPIRSNPESDPNRSPSRSKRSDPGFVDGQCHALLFHNASHCNTHFRVNMSVLTPAKGVHDCLLGRHRGSSLFSSLSFNHSSFITSFTMEEWSVLLPCLNRSTHLCLPFLSLSKHLFENSNNIKSHDYFISSRHNWTKPCKLYLA